MEFIIAQGNRKRRLEGPFGICASRPEFKHLRNQIDTLLDREPTFSYGWLTIQDKIDVYGPLNTAPEPWDDTEQMSVPADRRYID